MLLTVLESLASYPGKEVVHQSICYSLDASMLTKHRNKRINIEAQNVVSIQACKFWSKNGKPYRIFKLIRLLMSGNGPVKELPSNHLSGTMKSITREIIKTMTKKWKNVHRCLEENNTYNSVNSCMLLSSSGILPFTFLPDK